MQQAWDEYGEDAFEFVIIEEVDDDNLLQVEDTYLALNAGQSHCYNTALSTQIPSSTQREVRHKISKTLKENYASGYVHPRTGQKNSPETIAKIVEVRANSDKNKGEKHYRYGKSVSEETRKKMSEAAKKRAARGILPDNKGKVPWNKGKKTGPHSPEQNKKISESLKKTKRSKKEGPEAL